MEIPKNSKFRPEYCQNMNHRLDCWWITNLSRLINDPASGRYDKVWLVWKNGRLKSMAWGCKKKLWEWRDGRWKAICCWLCCSCHYNLSYCYHLFPLLLCLPPLLVGGTPQVPNPKDPDSRKYCVHSESTFFQKYHTGDGQDTLTKTPSHRQLTTAITLHCGDDIFTYRREDTISFRHSMGKCMLHGMTKAFDVTVAVSRAIFANVISRALKQARSRVPIVLSTLKLQQPRLERHQYYIQTLAALTNDSLLPRPPSCSIASRPFIIHNRTVVRTIARTPTRRSAIEHDIATPRSHTLSSFYPSTSTAAAYV